MLMFYEVADGVTLRFVNVRVEVTGDTQLIFSGEANSRLIIWLSRFKACDMDSSGFGLVRVVLSTLKEPVGAVCDDMELEDIGDLKIVYSRLRTDDLMELRPENRVVIRNSTLDATNPSVNGKIFIGTGFGAPSLHTLLKKSRMLADGDITIDAIENTAVIKNKFQAGGSIMITGNPCTSKFNRPNVPCSP
jgi:hypothetical protein